MSEPLHPEIHEFLALAKRESIKNRDLAERIGSAANRFSRWKNDRSSAPPEFIYLCKLMTALHGHGFTIPQQLDFVDKWEEKKESLQKMRKRKK